MIPSVGRIVHYTLNESDATAAEKKRGDGSAHGNTIRTGDVYPMLIVRNWGNSNEDASVQGQVFLDGDYSIWVTSRKQGTDEGQWFEPARVSVKKADT